MAAYKRRALELLDLMAKLDPGAAGVTLVQLRRSSGHSRDRVASSLLWLLLHGAVRRTADLKLWLRTDEDDDEDVEIIEANEPIHFDLTDNAEEMLSSLSE
jgi:hypothetical protein